VRCVVEDPGCCVVELVRAPVRCGDDVEDPDVVELERDWVEVGREVVVEDPDCCVVELERESVEAGREVVVDDPDVVELERESVVAGREVVVEDPGCCVVELEDPFADCDKAAKYACPIVESELSEFQRSEVPCPG